MASNEIHEDILYELADKGHELNAFGIGTNLITCLKQPALGMVYKLVSVNGVARLKLSEDFEKITLPGLKSIYRIYLADSAKPSFDLMALKDEELPQEGKPLEVIDSANPKETLSFTPLKIELINPLAFDGRVLLKPLKAKDAHELIYQQLDNFNPEIVRKKEPKKYPVYLSTKLYKLTEALMVKAKSK